MAEFKLVINDPKTGKSTQKEVKDLIAKKFLGLRVGSLVKGEIIDMPGYELEVRGGSDHAGFPMRPDLKVTGRKKVLITKGVGLREKRKGIRRRKTVCGNTIFAKIVQINLKIVKYGKAIKEAETKEEEKSDKKPEIKEEKTEQDNKTEVKEEPIKETKEKSKGEEDSKAEQKDKADKEPEAKEEKPKENKEGPKGEEKSKQEQEDKTEQKK